jgi:zona occludens toxin
MIELITGLPGNAKTVNMLRTVIDRAAAENRAVYYSGIKGLIHDDPRLKGTSWTPIEADKWMDCPDGSIIVIDECQKSFRNRTLGTHPPKHVTDLEEHRHRGIDFYMATQHPSLVDPALRRLVQTHRHMVRIFGMEASTIHRWERCVDNPDKPQFRKDSEKVRWVFDKSLYGLYVSATIHTAKKRIPLRVWGLVAVPLLVVAAIGGVYWFTRGKHDDGKVETAKAGARKVPGHVSSASGGGDDPMFNADPASLNRKQDRNRSGADDPVQDMKEYVWKETPRVVGLPQTAPKYDELTRPSRVPVPAMCFQKGDLRETKDVQCKCYSQQATPMDVPFNLCIEFARNGRFQDFDPDANRADASRADRSVAVLSNRPDAPVPVRQVQEGPAVTVLPGKPMGPARTDTSPGLNESGEIEDGPPNNRATRAAAGVKTAGL